jgi:hypothetical protein
MTTSRSRLRTARWPKIAASLGATALGLSFGDCECKAQSPDRGETRTVQGVVRSSTTAPMGEIDGAVLDSGTVIHWPPHMSDRFGGIAVRGDQVRAIGWMETGPEGNTHLEVQTVTNLRTNASVENDAPEPLPAPGPRRPRGPGAPPPPPGPRPRSRVPAAARALQGTVERLTIAPIGEIDGAILDDGTVIHWPPHLADRFSAVVARGDRIKVSGWMETGPAGDRHFESQSVTNLRTNATAAADVAGPLSAATAAIAADGSSDFAASADRAENVEKRLKALEDQITQLRAEIRRLQREP